MQTQQSYQFSYHFLVIIILTLLCGIIYSNTLHVPFVFDDLPNISENPLIGLTKFELATLYDTLFESPSSSRPLANLSFALNHYFGGYDVTAYHLVNIAIHLVNGILVYFISLLTIKQFAINKPENASGNVILLAAAFAAAIFIAHPLQTQSVTYIVQRMSSMATLFYFLSLLFFIIGRLTERQRSRWILLTCCFILWVLALGTKQTAATLPVIIFLYEWYFFQDLNKGWIKRNIKYFVGLVLLLFIISFIYLGIEPLERVFAGYDSRDFTLGERVMTQFRVIIFYLTLVLFPLPSRLNLIHDFPLSYSLLDPVTTLLSLTVIVLSLFLAIVIARKERLISFCILWFFINLLIESSVISLEIIFEHRLYLPMFGFAFLSGLLFFQLFQQTPKLIALFSLVLVLVLGTATYSRNNIWRDEISLWSDVISKNPQSHRAHYNLGNAFKDIGNIDDAIKHYNFAIIIRPAYANAHNNLGNILKQQGNLQAALFHYQKTLENNKNFPVTHYNLANLMSLNNNLEKAVYHYNQAIRLDASFAMAHNNLGIVMARLDKRDEAILHFTEAIRIEPKYIDALLNLGRAYWLKNNKSTACKHFRQVLKIKPNYLITQKGELIDCKLQ